MADISRYASYSEWGRYVINNVYTDTNPITLPIRECGSTLYVGLACAVLPSSTNFRLTFLLTRPQEALYEDLPV